MSKTFRELVFDELLETGLFDVNSEIEAAFLHQTVERILLAAQSCIDTAFENTAEHFGLEVSDGLLGNNSSNIEELPI